MDYKATKENWKSKQQSGTGYHSSVPANKKKKLTREDFKKDVEESVRKGLAKGKAKKKPVSYKGAAKGSLESWKVSDLRKLLNDKKRNLLVKSGFPEGKLPRSKAGMIALCKKLKRKRW